MDPIKLIRKKAKSDLKRIVLPENNDIRVIQAAAQIVKKKIARIIFLGDVKETKGRLRKFGDANIDAIEIIDPKNSDMLDVLTEEFYKRRKHKHPNKDFSKKILLDNYVFVAAMMLTMNLADGFVAGASYTTRDVAKAAIRCIDLDEKIGIALGTFVIYAKGSGYGDDGLFIFADCGLIPDPNPRQLAGIAVSSAKLYEQLFTKEPYVAMLSYSTKGSAGGPAVDKVRKGTEEARKLNPKLIVDGELQADSALDPLIAERKTCIKTSGAAGRANVLIFPNLDSGNIAYKLIQRLAGARAIGPLIVGLKRPCSDLSRGCSVEDIVDAVAITAVRAQVKFDHMIYAPL